MLPPNSGLSHVEYNRLLPAIHVPVSSFKEKNLNSEQEIFQKPLPTSRKELIDYKKNLQLSDIQKETAVGLLLGDASLQSQSNNTNPQKSWRLKFCYGKKHEVYANHIYDIFSNWCLSEPRLVTGRESVSFQTISHPDLQILSDLFLLNTGKKGISENLVQNHLTSRGLAYWYMDDGGKLDYSKNQGKGIVLNTQCFTKSEVESLEKGLKTKFDLETWVKPNKKGHIIAISGKSYETFLTHIDPFLHESMRYKLPTARKSRVNILLLKDNPSKTNSQQFNPQNPNI